MNSLIVKYRFVMKALLVTICFFGCSQKPGFETEKQKLLLLHNEQQIAHINKNARLFVDQFSNKMISVNRGKISTTTKDSALIRFQSYFGKVHIKEWKDLNPPLIDFSDDASMAYMVVDKLVILNYTDEQDKMIEESTHFAWVSIFKKKADGDWEIVCNVSTNEQEARN